MNRLIFGIALYLMLTGFCQSSEYLEKPSGDSPLIKTIPNLPEHEAVRVNFVLEVLGTWDGVGYFGPSNWSCEVGGKKVFNTAFNNFYQRGSVNIWQTYPDPFHKKHQMEIESGNLGILNPGGLGSLRERSIDPEYPDCVAAYRFSFTVPHTGEDLEVKFNHYWPKEEKDTTQTYRIHYLKVVPLEELKAPTAAEVDAAWMAMFQASGIEANKAWQNVFLAHPDLFIKRIQLLLDAKSNNQQFASLNRKRKGELYQNYALYADPPRAEGNPLTIGETRLMAVLAMIQFHHIDKKWFENTDLMPQRDRVTFKFLGYHMDTCPMVRKVFVRLRAYLDLIGSQQASDLSKKLDIQ